MKGWKDKKKGLLFLLVHCRVDASFICGATMIRLTMAFPQYLTCHNKKSVHKIWSYWKKKRKKWYKTCLIRYYEERSVVIRITQLVYTVRLWFRVGTVNSNQMPSFNSQEPPTEPQLWSSLFGTHNIRLERLFFTQLHSRETDNIFKQDHWYTAQRKTPCGEWIKFRIWFTCL